MVLNLQSKFSQYVANDLRAQHCETLFLSTRHTFCVTFWNKGVRYQTGIKVMTVFAFELKAHYSHFPYLLHFWRPPQIKQCLLYHQVMPGTVVLVQIATSFITRPQTI